MDVGMSRRVFVAQHVAISSKRIVIVLFNAPYDNV